MIESYKARLIAVTKPVSSEFRSVGDRGEIEYGDANDLLTYCARVSNPSNQDNFETGEKLLRYCIKKKHWSIFTMADLVIEIEATRDITRQILRHVSFDFQEFSQRYADPTQMGFVTREARFQDHTNRQNSIELDPNNDDHIRIKAEWETDQKFMAEMAKQIYNKHIRNGLAKEQARAILPEGMTMSRMYMKGSVRSWFHYSAVRMMNDTQKEHRIVANQTFDILKEQFPWVESVKVSVGE